MKRYTPMLLALLVLSFASAQVTVSSDGYPVGPMPTPEQQEANPDARIRAEVLQEWLDANPEVNFTRIDVDMWNQQALVTTIVGGTSPTFFAADVVGGYSDAGYRAAVTQGLLADTTEASQSTGYLDSLLPEVRAIWENKQVDGRYYGVPFSIISGNGVVFRRDLIEEAGLTVPEPGWTWDDFHELARGLNEAGPYTGAALQNWNFTHQLLANQFSLLTRVPDPETPWNWRWDFSSQMDRWVRVIEGWREMVSEERSVFAPSFADDNTIRNAFANGETAMIMFHADYFTTRPSHPDVRGPAAIADDLGRPVEEVVGWVPLPEGEMGAFGGTQAFISNVGFAPQASAEEITKAIELIHYMTFGEGVQKMSQARLELVEDPDPREFVGILSMTGNTNPDLPDAADVWGAENVTNIRAATQIPLIPAESQFIPAEETPGPNPDTLANEAVSDALNRLIYTEGDIDIEATLLRAEAILNQQAQSFTSSVPDDVFVAGVSDYYAAVDAFWQENAPEFHAEIYRPWYDEYVAPVLESEQAGN